MVLPKNVVGLGLRSVAEVLFWLIGGGDLVGPSFIAETFTGVFTVHIPPWLSLFLDVFQDVLYFLKRDDKKLATYPTYHQWFAPLFFIQLCIHKYTNIERKFLAALAALYLPLIPAILRYFYGLHNRFQHSLHNLFQR